MREMRERVREETADRRGRAIHARSPRGSTTVAWSPLGAITQSTTMPRGSSLGAKGPAESPLALPSYFLSFSSSSSFCSFLSSDERARAVGPLVDDRLRRDIDTPLDSSFLSSSYSRALYFIQFYLSLILFDLIFFRSRYLSLEAICLDIITESLVSDNETLSPRTSCKWKSSSRAQ